MAYTETLARYLDYEAMAAARKLLSEVMGLKEGETVVITNDSSGDERVARVMGAAAYSLGGVPIEVRYPTNLVVTNDPPVPVGAALRAANVWIELNVAYILDSQTQRAAAAAGVRYICLTGMDIDTLIRTVGRVDMEALFALGKVLAELTNQADHVEVTCADGTNLSADYKGRTALVESVGTSPGAVVMMGGQTNWIPHEETVSGTAVFDGSFWPPDSAGVLTAPITMDFEKGFARRIRGGRQASKLRDWLDGFHDENMFRFAHFSYGYHPGVQQPSGRVEEDERVFGCLCIGLGSQTINLVDKPVDVTSHTDGTILFPTVRLSGLLIEENGRYVHPKLVAACRALRVPGYD